MKRESNITESQPIKTLTEYLSGTPGLKYKLMDNDILEVSQTTDQKTLKFDMASVTEVLSRTDSEGLPFIQVNFNTGKKILFTHALIGFKPAPILGLDLTKLPKVVTTPDLVSVFEAIEEALSHRATGDDLETLKKVFNSILAGGELVGFDLSQERQWLWCLMNTQATA